MCQLNTQVKILVVVRGLEFTKIAPYQGVVKNFLAWRVASGLSAPVEAEKAEKFCSADIFVF